MLVVSQILKELKRYHDVEALDDVRVIRERQTSTRPVLSEDIGN